MLITAIERKDWLLWKMISILFATIDLLGGTKSYDTAATYILVSLHAYLFPARRRIVDIRKHELAVHNGD